MAKPNGKQTVKIFKREATVAKAGRRSRTGGEKRGKGKSQSAKPVVKPQADTAETLFWLTSTKTRHTDIVAMVDGVSGIYGIKTDGGTVILECFDYFGKASIKVIASTLANVQISEVFLYCYLLQRESLEKVTSDYAYERQLEIFNFLKANLPREAFEVKKAKDPQVISLKTGKPMGAKERAKMAKEQQAFVAERSTTSRINEMKRDAITLRQATISGKVGNFILADGKHEAVLQHCVEGISDHLVKLLYLSSEHPLRFQGCVDSLDGRPTFVYVGQIRKGEVDWADRLNQKLSEVEVKQKNALIAFVRKHLESEGINLKAPGANLQKQKTA